VKDDYTNGWWHGFSWAFIVMLVGLIIIQMISGSELAILSGG
jgi:hypothetical protein